MNKKLINEINKSIADTRKNLQFQNKHFQKNMVEQLELSLCKTFEYVSDQSKFLKAYIMELRRIESKDQSVVLLDAFFDVMNKTNQNMTSIRRVYQDTKQDLGGNDDIEELNIIIFHLTEMNEIIRIVKNIEEILFSYPP